MVGLSGQASIINRQFQGNKHIFKLFSNLAQPSLVKTKSPIRFSTVAVTMSCVEVAVKFLNAFYNRSGACPSPPRTRWLQWPSEGSLCCHNLPGLGCNLIPKFSLQ